MFSQQFNSQSTNCSSSQSCFNYPSQFTYHFPKIQSTLYPIPENKSCIFPFQNQTSSQILQPSFQIKNPFLQEPSAQILNSRNNNPFLINNDTSNSINQKQIDYSYLDKYLENSMKKFFTAEIINSLSDNTGKNGNYNLKEIFSRINNSSSQINQDTQKINDNYATKFTESNVFLKKLEQEIFENIKQKLISIENELISEFNNLTNFHGFDEGFLNEGKNGIMQIHLIIKDCYENLSKKISEINQETNDYNNEIIVNSNNFMEIIKPEIIKLNELLEEVVKRKNQKNESIQEIKNLGNQIIQVINNIKGKFVYAQKMNNEKNNIFENNENNIEFCDNNNNNGVNIYDNNKNVEDEKNNNENSNEEERLGMQNNVNKMATLSFIKKIHKAKKNKKYK